MDCPSYLQYPYRLGSAMAAWQDFLGYFLPEEEDVEVDGVGEGADEEDRVGEEGDGEVV